jgi:hypothetical protein
MFWKKNAQEHSCCSTQGPAIIAKAEDGCPDEVCAVPTPSTDTATCSASGTTGFEVELITLKALLNARSLRRLDGGRYRFCPSADCDVVYFDNEAGSVFRKSDLTVRVGQKEKSDPIPVCYCLDFTLEDIRRDLATRGRTEIPGIITNEVKRGHCACEVKNPQGSCCLGDITKAVKRIQSAEEEI